MMYYLEHYQRQSILFKRYLLPRRPIPRQIDRWRKFVQQFIDFEDGFYRSFSSITSKFRSFDVEADENRSTNSPVVYDCLEIIRNGITDNTFTQKSCFNREISRPFYPNWFFQRVSTQ
uniref:AlNc14C138G7155 protein n=1 Tax=Albugo laibachii Nc14 TaxID=890382 RepID=F0WKW5_9STRA|nr:AlNc14C138G7155 [Albugo laibachii Nc14]|eukprot:CCA21924.1 AlNc14C138G7155 [Albugo laibachii Nc14]